MDGRMGSGGAVLLALLLLGAMLSAPPAAAAELRIRVVGAEADATTAFSDPETGLYVLAPPTGHVEAEYGARSLRARRAEYRPGPGILLLTGAVRLEEPGLTAEAGRMRADLRQEEYLLEEGVRIERFPADGPLSVLTAGAVIYWPAAGEAEASGGVRVEDGPRWLQAASARLRDGFSRLELAGDVTGDWGDWVVERAHRVQVDLEGGGVTLFGPAEILFPVSE